MTDTKKKIAAITAVLHYLQKEENAREKLAISEFVPISSDNFWNFSGRQSQMTMRNMAQMRLFPSWQG